MSWFYWFGKSNNKSNFLEDLNAENPVVFSKEEFDKLNAKIELLTFEKNSLEVLLSMKKNQVLIERNENEKLRVHLSNLERKLQAIASIAECDASFEVAAEEVVKTDDILDRLDDDPHNLDVERHWFQSSEADDVELPPFPEMTKLEDIVSATQDLPEIEEEDNPWDQDEFYS